MTPAQEYRLGTRNAAQPAEDDVMTDEQYIDDLFNREGIGWDKTPGFRAFVLDLMGIIGERPRAGDVASMHMAYGAGLEQAGETQADRFEADAETEGLEQSLHSDILVKRAIELMRKIKTPGKKYIYPLWKRVSDLFGHGSGYSAEICRRHGFNPDEQWKDGE